MSGPSVRPGALLVFLAGCGGATSGSAPAAAPAPRAGEPAAPAPTTPGRGPVVIYRPVRSAPYRLERHDSLSLQYPGGANPGAGARSRRLPEIGRAHV